MQPRHSIIESFQVRFVIRRITDVAAVFAVNLGRPVAAAGQSDEPIGGQ